MKLTKNRIKQIIREELQNEIKLSRNDPRNPPKYQQGGQRLRRTNPRNIFSGEARPYGDAHSSGGWLEPDDQKSHSVAIVDDKTRKIVRLFHDVPSEVVHRAMLGTSSSHRKHGAPDKLDLEIEKSLGLNDSPTANLYVVQHADGVLGLEWDEEKREMYAPELTDEKLKELFDIDLEGRGHWTKPSEYRYRRIPTFEYIERFYPNMPWYDYNDFLTPIGPRGGKRQAGPVIDLEDGE